MITTQGGRYFIYRPPRTVFYPPTTLGVAARASEVDRRSAGGPKCPPYPLRRRRTEESGPSPTASEALRNGLACWCRAVPGTCSLVFCHCDLHAWCSAAKLVTRAAETCPTRRPSRAERVAWEGLRLSGGHGCAAGRGTERLYQGQRLAMSGRAGCKDRWTKRGGELGLFQISKIDKTTLTYAKLVRLNSPTGYTKQTTQANKDMKLSKVELSYDL